MTDAPETIWTTGNSQTGSWNDSDVRHCPGTEYTRTDIHDISQARIAELEAALTDSNAALSTFVDLTKYTREPYETPLSAHDRARDILEALKAKP